MASMGYSRPPARIVIDRAPVGNPDDDMTERNATAPDANVHHVNVRYISVHEMLTSLNARNAAYQNLVHAAREAQSLLRQIPTLDTAIVEQETSRVALLLEAALDAASEASP